LLIERYVIVYRFLVDSHGLPTEEWLHARLAALAAFRRKDEAGTGPVWVAASQDALATMIGVSRQTLSLLLTRLEDRGLVEVGFRGIRILG
jgi:DNA-binding MarR family transcriptional regulator